MVVRVVGVTLAALSIASAAGGAATATVPASGLYGVVMRGPTKPVCKDYEPCEEPAVGLVLQFKQSGRLVAQVRTGKGGRYSVKLRRGRYAVTTARRTIGAGLAPESVRVPRRRAHADFYLDTGIQ